MGFINSLNEIAKNRKNFARWEQEQRDTQAKRDALNSSREHTPEELENIADVLTTMHYQKPNVVMDIYKNRRGKMCNIKIFRYFDYGTCRSQDIIATHQDYSGLGDLPILKYATTEEEMGIYDIN